jgi:hypothetical protein
VTADTCIRDAHHIQRVGRTKRILDCRPACTAISRVRAARDRDQAATLFDHLFGDPESSTGLAWRARKIRFITDSRGLLISCAIVAAIRPVAASFSDWIRTCSIRLRSEMSRTILEAPITRPFPSFNRRDCHRNVQDFAIFSDSCRLVMVDPFSRSQLSQDLLFFILQRLGDKAED